MPSLLWLVQNPSCDSQPETIITCHQSCDWQPENIQVVILVTRSQIPVLQVIACVCLAARASCDWFLYLIENCLSRAVLVRKWFFILCASVSYGNELLFTRGNCRFCRACRDLVGGHRFFIWAVQGFSYMSVSKLLGSRKWLWQHCGLTVVSAIWTTRSLYIPKSLCSYLLMHVFWE